MKPSKTIVTKHVVHLTSWLCVSVMWTVDRVAIALTPGNRGG